LDDLSPRAARYLAEADRIVAEDTRRARTLLSHLGIEGKPLERLDAQVEARGVDKWLERLEAGERIALVSDAGTPGVSDPGATLVRRAAERGVAITPLPGASAVLAALSVSGFAGDRFRFIGFLPRAGRERRDALELLAATEETALLFEAPSRMTETLQTLARAMPDRDAMIAREITKLHEELLRGTLSELAEREHERAWRGEITVALGPHAAGPREPLDATELDVRIDAVLAQGRRAKDVAKALSLETGWSARSIYERISARRNEPKAGVDE
jgi:16S rRNA (cytidine1402-2'-O)-methyltransferase